MSFIDITLGDIPAWAILAVVVIVVLAAPRILRAWHGNNDGDIWEFANQTARHQAALKKEVEMRGAADDKAHAQIAERMAAMEKGIKDIATNVGEMRGEMRAHFNAKK